MDCESVKMKINGVDMGVVRGIEITGKLDGKNADDMIGSLVEMVEEARKKQLEEEKTQPQNPEYCPYHTDRGCIDGEVWLIKHIEHEKHIETQHVRIRGNRCRAWSDEYGRCLRIEPVWQSERMYGKAQTPRTPIVPRPVSIDEITKKNVDM